jgi:oligopeptidase B
MSIPSASRTPSDEAGPSSGADVAPPTAARRPVQREHHGDVFLDEYEWLRDSGDPEAIAYLNAENTYTDACTERLGDLRTTIFDEIVARTKQTDLSVPYRKGDFWYYSRTVEGQQYSIHCRVAADGTEPPATDSGAIAGEQIMLDGNQAATCSEFFALGTLDVTPDGNLLAYSVDLTGDERFTMLFKDLRTGRDLADQITNVHYSSAWSADGSVLFYLTVDEAWRPDRVWRHVLGTDPSTDIVVLAESDERFWIGLDLTRNEQAIQISLASKLTSEVWLIDSTDPLNTPALIAQRRDGIEYEIEHAGDHLLVVHNDGAENFALASATLDRPDQWQTLIPSSADRRLLGIDAFADHAVLYERHEGLTRLSVLPRDGDGYSVDAARPIRFDEALFTVTPGTNPQWDAASYRLHYTSMTTPDSVHDYDISRRTLTLRKQQPVLGDVDLGAYVQSREWATASDGAHIPISVVRRADVSPDGNAPVVLYGYGSYEHSIDPYFSVPRLSLLDRGVVYAIAHVRGGGEMGRHWYEQGKLLSKKNTFTDFIAVAEHLVDTGWTAADRIVAQGGSAGGLLIGAVANMSPQAFGGFVAQVPFVDPLTTILDPSLPLTVTEWEEWGNPLADARVYEYMKSYSPYENVGATRYPPILAMTSLHDTRVFFVEPAKWVARLRASSLSSPTVLLRTEMDAGHGGRSGRYDRWREQAFVMSWQLDVLGIV